MRTLHDHSFSGPDSFTSPQALEADDREADALRSAVTLQVKVDAFTSSAVSIAVQVQSHLSGHNLPTGSSFFRQMWLEFTAVDPTGQVVFESGVLDDLQDLRDVHGQSPDPDLVMFGATLTDVAGAPTLFPWRARHRISTALAPDSVQDFVYTIPHRRKAGALVVRVRMRMRPYSPRLLRAIGMTAESEQIPIFDLKAVTLAVP